MKNSHMRKLSVVLLAFCLLCFEATIAKAEGKNETIIAKKDGDFVFDYNVMFGDSISDIKAKDQSTKDKKTYPISATFKNYNIYEESIQTHCELAGLEFVLYYCFDTNAKLKEIRVACSDDDRNGVYTSNVERAYFVLADELTKMYGDPLSDNNPYHSILGPAVENSGTIHDSLEYTNAMGFELTAEKASHLAWLFEYNGYYVKIDLGFFETKHSFTNIDYYMLTKDEFDALST